MAKWRELANDTQAIVAIEEGLVIRLSGGWVGLGLPPLTRAAQLHCMRALEEVCVCCGAGPDIVPFTREHQEIMIQGFEEVVLGVQVRPVRFAGWQMQPSVPLA